MGRVILKGRVFKFFKVKFYGEMKGENFLFRFIIVLIIFLLKLVKFILISKKEFCFIYFIIRLVC